MKKNLLITIIIIVIITVGGGAFYSGMVYGKNQNSQKNGQFGQNGRARTGAGPAGSGFISGDIVSKNAGSITVKDRTGSSRIIFYSQTTEVGKFMTGALSDVSVGQNIMVSGKTNSDGSITAQTIQIRPAQPQGQGSPEKNLR